MAILHVSFPNDVFRNRSRPITFARYALALVSIRLAKAMGRRVVWTIHNLANHEGYHTRLETAFMERYTDVVDLTVHLSATGRDAAIARFPRLAAKPAVVIPHPHYATAATSCMAREAALTVLGLPPDCRMILAFGVVRRYKNLLKLVRAFNDLPGDNRLVVAGNPLDKRLAETLRNVANPDRVTLMLRDIGNAELGTLFSAASLVVAPYLDILNSGTAFMSLTLHRPVLVPARGAMTDLPIRLGRTGSNYSTRR